MVEKGDECENSMIMSLEFMLKLLSKTCTAAVDTFFIIGIMKHGLFQADLETILQSDVSESLHHLV